MRPWGGGGSRASGVNGFRFSPEAGTVLLEDHFDYSLFPAVHQIVTRVNVADLALSELNLDRVLQTFCLEL